MGKAGRPPGRTYPHSIRVQVSDEMHSWLEQMSSVLDVSVAEAARMCIEVGMASTAKSMGTGEGDG